MLASTLSSMMFSTIEMPRTLKKPTGLLKAMQHWQSRGNIWDRGGIRLDTKMIL